VDGSLRLRSLFGEIVRTYFAWARTLLPLAFFVFVPLGLVHAIPVHVEATSFDFENGIAIFGAVPGWCWRCSRRSRSSAAW
jgi:hypothetical protein